MTDFSERADHAADIAFEIAEKTASGILLYNLFYLPAVTPAQTGVFPYYEEYEVIEKTVTRDLEDAAERLRAKAGESAVAINYMHRPVNPGESIFELIDRSGIWLAVMGKNARPGMFSEFFLGSITRDVLEQAFCPVLLVPFSKTHLAKNFRIAFASGMAESDLPVLREITRFAEVFDAGIIVIHVAGRHISPMEREQRIGLFRDMVRQVPYLLISYEEIEGEKVVDTLAEFTRVAGVDVLALVHHRHSFLTEILKGSTARRLLNYPDAMLLVFPAAKSSH